LHHKLFNEQQNPLTMAKKKKQKPVKPKSTLGKIWFFIWHEDSFLSWMVNIILAVVLIKFLIYPGIGLLMGTKFPIVAVVSSSMDHHGNFDDWWNRSKDFYIARNISKEQFQEYAFKNGFDKGDLMVLLGTNKDEIKQGDVVVFISGKPYPIIHRVIATTDNHFETKGDANSMQIQAIDLNERNVPYTAVVGKAWFKIPFIGYVKIIFVQILNFFGIPAF
jgi:signal peptidase I